MKHETTGVRATAIHALVIAALVTLSPIAAADDPLHLGSGHMHRCDSEPVRGPTSMTSSPEENAQCKLLGRVFCMVQEFRGDNISADAAVTQVAESLSHIGQTGSHVSTNYRPLVAPAAEYVYSHDKILPWTRYYYAVYTCGLNERVTDAAARKSMALSWEQAAHECEQQHPGAGDGYPNDPLRDCLQGAMDTAVAEVKPTAPAAAKSAKK